MSASDSWEDWSGIIFTGIVVILLLILCPSKHKMEEEISRDLIEESMYQASALFQLDQYADLLDLNTDHLSDDEVINKVSKLGTIKVKNYGVVKLGYFTKKGKKKEHLAGIGICGFVITKSLIRNIAK